VDSEFKQLDVENEIEVNIIAPIKKHEIRYRGIGCSIAVGAPFITYFCLRELAGTSKLISLFVAIACTVVTWIFLAHIAGFLENRLYSRMDAIFERSFPDGTPLRRAAMEVIYRQKEKSDLFKIWVRKRFRED